MNTEQCAIWASSFLACNTDDVKGLAVNRTKIVLLSGRPDEVHDLVCRHILILLHSFIHNIMRRSLTLESTCAGICSLHGCKLVSSILIYTLILLILLLHELLRHLNHLEILHVLLGTLLSLDWCPVINLHTIRIMSSGICWLVKFGYSFNGSTSFRVYLINFINQRFHVIEIGLISIMNWWLTLGPPDTKRLAAQPPRQAWPAGTLCSMSDRFLEWGVGPGRPSPWKCDCTRHMIHLLNPCWLDILKLNSKKLISLERALAFIFNAIVCDNKLTTSI